MSPVKLIKATLVGGCAVLGLLYTASSSFSKPADPGDEKKAQAAASAKYSPEDFVGSETCKACHEEQHQQLLEDRSRQARESRLED